MRIKSLIFTGALFLASSLRPAPAPGILHITVASAGTGTSLEPAGKMLIYAEDAPGSFPAPTEHARLLLKKDLFESSFVPVLAGQAVDLCNGGSSSCELFSYSELHPFNFDLGPQDSCSAVFSRLPKSGLGVVRVFARDHPAARASILILRNPYWAVLPESGGQARLEVPAGTYLMKTWHPRLKQAWRKVLVKPGRVSRLRFLMPG